MIFHLERRELAKQDLDGALFFINELLQSHNSFTQQGDFCRSAVSGGAVEGRKVSKGSSFSASSVCWLGEGAAVVSVCGGAAR